MQKSPRRAADQGDPVPIPLGDAARDLVYRRLARQARHYPDLAISGLDIAQASGPLDSRDAAFAHAVYDAAIRRWLTLDYILSRFLDGHLAEIEPRLRAVLIAGAAQMLFLDRVPAHAVINHAVEWSKQRIRPGAGGVVNAVLRKVAALRMDPGEDRRERYTDRRDELPLSDGTALALREDVLPESDSDRLAVASSTPLELLRAWEACMAAREVKRIALHGLAVPPVILNTSHARSPLPVGPEFEPHAAPGHHVYSGGRVELAIFLESRRDLWVQDPASSLAVSSVADLPVLRGLILDLCAGQGTKTRQLSAAFPDAAIVSTDIDPVRRRTLAAAFTGSDQVRVVEPTVVREQYFEKADLILLDVPCTNTGVLARRPEAKYRFGAGSLESLVQTQRQIIADAIPLLAAGRGVRGRLLYSTCSLEPQENAHAAAWAAKWHGFTVSREHQRLPVGGPGEAPAQYSDGSYAILLT
jgi:16S rRNA (cytosine967-C5)-methyltransferase